MNNNISEIVKKMETIEKRVLMPHSDEKEAWYDIRLNIFYKITILLGVYDTAHVTKRKPKNNFYKLKLKIKRFSYALYTWLPLHIILKKEYIFWGHPRRKLESDGYYWDLYTDPVIFRIFKNNALTIEKSYGLKHYKPVPVKNMLHVESFNFFKKLHIKRVIVPDKVVNTLNEIEVLIHEEFGINLNVADIGIDKYKKNKKAENSFLFLLKLLKPKVLFIVCSYGIEPLIRAARRRQIPTIELQHGVIDTNHLGYSFPKKIPKDSFPDYFFSFGEYWCTSAKLPIVQDKVFNIGYPYLEQKASDVKLYDKKNQVIFISQGIIGRELSKFAVEYAIKHPEIRVIYKLHPGEIIRWKYAYIELKEASEKGTIKVIDGQKPPLYDLFKYSLIQIGVNSTAIFEGIRFGCKTYLVDLPGVEYMRGIIDSGMATLISSIDEISIEKDTQPKLEDIHALFAPNWESNFKKALNIILEKNSV